MTSRRRPSAKGRSASGSSSRSSTRRPPGRSAPARKGKAVPRARRRLIAGMVVSVVLVGFLLVGVFPTRAWLAQRQDLQARQAELEGLDEEQQAIEDEVARLQTPEEVERIARQEYGMVGEDETAFRMLPAAEEPVDLPDTWPFLGTEDWLNR